MTHQLAILAYGSLLADPGKELRSIIVDRMSVETPFEVEYARCSSSRAGAPTLVRVPVGKGSRVHAQMLVLADDIGLQKAKDRLYRREINRVGEMDIAYDHAAQLEKDDGVLIRELEDLEGIPTVLYAYLQPKLDFIFSEAPPEEKANRLAALSMSSVTKDTFFQKRDAIQYLADAIQNDIHTPLTDLYRQAILEQVGKASNLGVARRRIASQKGLIGEVD